MDIEHIRGLINFVCAFLNLILAIILWSKRREKITFHLGCAAFFSAIYAFTFGGMYFFEHNKLYWSKGSWLGVLIIPAYLLFVYYFTGKTKYIKLKALFWYSGAILISYLALATPYIAGSLSSQYPYVIPESYDVLAPFGRVFIISGLIISLIYLLKGYFNSEKGFRKLQLQYFILGTSIYSVGGIITAGILPLFYPEFTSIDISIFLSIFWVGLTTYAIFKRELFGIKVILAHLLVITFAVLLFFQIFFSTGPINYIWNISLLIIFLIFGRSFIESVYEEMRRRKEAETIKEGIKIYSKEILKERNLLKKEIEEKVEKLRQKADELEKTIGL